MKFDVCIMNPPYNNGLHEKFLYECIKFSNIISSVQPIAWLVSTKQSKKLTSILNNIYTNVKIIDGNNYFDASFASKISLIYINKYLDYKIIFNNKQYIKFSDIKPYSIYNNIEIFAKSVLCKLEISLYNKLKCTTVEFKKLYEKNPNDNWICLMIPKIRGHINTDDFYTIISNDNSFIFKEKVNTYKELYNLAKNKSFIYFAFNTYDEVNNFIKYLKTDFCRCCLLLTKNGINQCRGQFKYIPYIDPNDEIFNNESIDKINDLLFKKFNIDNNIKLYIRNLLPDYYNIRNGK